MRNRVIHIFTHVIFNTGCQRCATTSRTIEAIDLGRTTVLAIVIQLHAMRNVTPPLECFVPFCVVVAFVTTIIGLSITNNN